MIGLTLTGYRLCTYAQQPDSPGIPQLAYHFRKMTQAEGLSSYNVKKIIQDGHGYTWIATQDGLDRFDGKNMIHYHPSADPTRQLLSNDIWSLALDTGHHCLWVLSLTGLNSIDLNSGQVLPNPPALAAIGRQFPKGYFHCLLLSGSRLWIGTQTGMSIYDIDRQVFVPVDPLLPGQEKAVLEGDVDQFWRDESGHIWALIDNYGIVIYSAAGRNLQRHPLAELGMSVAKSSNRFRAVVPLGKERVILSTEAGLLDIHSDIYSFHVQPLVLPGKAANLPRRDILFCASDPDGNLWLSADNALYRVDIATGQAVEIRDTDYANPENWFSGIYCIYFDPLGHLWLGTQKGIAFSTIAASPFTTYFQSSDYIALINHAYYAYPYSDRVLYVCAEDGFYQVNPMDHTIRRMAEGRFFYVTRLKDRRLLISGDGQLYVLQGYRLLKAEKVYPELTSVCTKAIIGLTWSGDSLAVMGSEGKHGIFCWYPKRHNLTVIDDTTRPLALESNIVNAVYPDQRGRIWVLGNTSISIYDPARRTIDTFHIDDPYTHLPASIYFDMTEAEGIYWLALYGTGVIGLDSALHLCRFISSKEGLANTAVYKVFAWQDSLLFVTSNKGLARIRLSDATVANYFQQDGLHGNGFEQGCGYADDQYIYAGGEHGVSRIEPSLIPVDPTPPMLRVGNIRLQTPTAFYDLGDVSASTLTVPSHVIRATLTVSGFNYTDDGRTQLAYSVPELKTQWIPLGTEQTIDLLGLAPGRYTLLVKASNSNGRPAERQLTLAIDWLPKWYQTVWFKLLVFIVLILLFYLFYRYRISQIRQQQVIRQNISSDLHDDIGSILNTIKIFTHLARKGPDADNWLTQIETSLAQAVVAVRDMIWVLDDSQDHAYELLERIRQFAIPLAAAQGIQLEVTASGSIQQPLRKDEKRHLLLVTKESVNNCLKYAQCRHLRIRIDAVGKSISLCVEDDGMGFDPNRITQGNGLRNIRRRAQKICYTATIESMPGAGTRILLTKD